MFFQKRQIELLNKKKSDLSEKEYDIEYEKIIDKACLCEDLAASALTINKIASKRPLKTAVCPGPNIAYFNKISTFKEMVSHIYGRLNLIQNPESRPHMFIKEFKMYISHFEKEIQNRLPKLDNKIVII